jgi:flagellar hook-associated protein 1 FlgK
MTVSTPERATSAKVSRCTTIQRNYSGFLTTQATLASAVSAGDTARADKLNQLQNLFPGGANALGAAVS